MEVKTIYKGNVFFFLLFVVIKDMSHWSKRY